MRYVINKDSQELIKQTKRLSLPFWQQVTHYFIVPFLLISPACFLLYGVKAHFEGREVDNYWAGVPFLILAIIFYLIQKRRLQFREVRIAYTEEDFQQALEKTVEDLQWQVVQNTSKVMRAHRPSNWTGSLGEMITIIKDKNLLLLNSIADPTRQGSVVTYGWNRKNINTFLLHMATTLKERQQQEGH